MHELKRRAALRKICWLNDKFVLRYIGEDYKKKETQARNQSSSFWKIAFLLVYNVILITSSY